VLERRTHLAIESGLEHAARAAELMGGVLKWDAPRRTAELERVSRRRT
jgi:hypothetical protein